MRQLPIALTIAGSDSGGGAGIQADLKTFAALGVHGTSVITALTAQNPKGVLGIAPTAADFVTLQLSAVFSELPPKALKTGMLFSDEILYAVVEFLRGLPAKKRPPIVVDPVMVATSRAALIADRKMPFAELLQMAALVTPNLDETEVLLDRPVREPEDLRAAARSLHQKYGCAALVKGGHLRTGSDAIDFFFDGKNEFILSAPFVRGVKTHGTGCTYSAAVAAGLAKNASLEKAIVDAKNFVSQSIAGSRRIGRHQTLANHLQTG